MQVPLATEFVGGMFGLFFTDESEVKSLKSVMACDHGQFTRFFHGMLNRGVYLAPSAYEASFISITHEKPVIQATVSAAKDVFREINQESLS
mgnify:CR=1 FL=1